jgi:DNA integrity scanning protein DisA with diadenylate cyclase activity
MARQFELQLTAWIFQGFFAVLVVLLVVVFQDDLRRLFEQIAALGLRRKASRPGEGSLAVLVRGLHLLAKKRRGALIVLPGREPVERHLQGGVALDATISGELLDSLFDAGSAGHDGALVMRDNRLERFAVHLTLSENREELGPGGTRHAAALGLAERSDALCLVVSEERGTIGIAVQGRLEILADPGALLDRMQDHLQRTGALTKPGGIEWRWLGQRLAEGLLSFALASGAWLVLVPGAAEEVVAHQVSVEVEQMPKGYVLEGVKPATVEVTVVGSRRAMVLATAADFRLQLDVDAKLIELGRRTFEVSVESINHETNLMVVDISPKKIRLHVRKEQ